MEHKYILNRIGLINFWYYQNQILELSDGHLLLRGRNGAGKSITMQSIIPVLLDGNIESSRLDSFGTRDRKMIDYLLGEKEVSGKNEAIGYLWVEYKIGEQYITTGIGIYGRRGSGNLSRWYFVINNGCRIGLDFSLMTNEKTDSATTLSKKQLKNKLGTSGQFFDSQKKYAEYISKNIFGFNSMDDFEDMISLLIKLRNPKLNNDLKPDKLERILSDSLPNLTEDNVQSSAKTLEQINHANENIEHNKFQEGELQPLLKAYKKYRHNRLVTLVHFVKQHHQQSEELTEKLSQWNDSRIKIEEEQSSIMNSNAILDMKLKADSQMKDRLASNDGFNLVSEAKKLKEKLRRANQNINSKEKCILINKDDIKKLENKISVFEEEKEKYKNEYSRLAANLENLSIQAGFENQHKLIFLTKGKSINVDIGQWKKESMDNLKRLEKIIDKFQERESNQRSVNRLDKRLDDENKKLDKFKKEQQNWESQYSDELFNLKQAFSEYRDTLVFYVEKDIIGEVQSNLDKIYTTEIPNLFKAIEPLSNLVNQYKGSLKNEIQNINSNMDKILDEINTFQKEQNEIKTQKYPVPERLQHRKKKRQNQELIPFYQLLEFKENIDSQTANKIEGALLESGILDGLVSSDGKIIVGDTILQANPKFFMPTLLDYLKPDIDNDKKISESKVLDLLTSIVTSKDITDEDVIITPEGEFKLGILVGKTEGNYEAQFIGATAQRRHQEIQIAKIQKIIDDKLVQLKKIRNSLTDKENKIEILDKDLIRMPRDDKLSELKFLVDKESQIIETQTKTTVELSEDLESQKRLLHHDLFEIKRLTKNDHSISKNEQAYKLAKLEMQHYIDSMNDWSKELNNINNIIGRIKDTNESLSRIKNELGIRQKELLQLINDIQDIELEIESNKKSQRLAGDLKEIREQLSKIYINIKNMKKSQKDNFAKLQDLAIQLEKMKSNIKNAQEKIKFEQPFTKLLVETLNKELSQEVGSNQSLQMELQDKLILDDPLDSEALNHDIEILDVEFTNHRNQLLEFRPRKIVRNTLEEPDWIKKNSNNKGNIDFWKLYLNHHQDVVVDLSGIEAPITKLDQRFKEQIQINLEAMTQGEEELFRVIIFDTLGKIIRQRINKAQDWVSDINKVLAQQDNNSNLKISIKWEIKPSDELSDNENQEGVALLKKDPKILNDQDLNKIKNFLNSKINAKKMDFENQGQAIIMPKVLSEALDYRQWFQFRILYTQNSNNKHQLTKNVFNKFSGGEKAITMYTPLFVAMAARYNNAHSNAPRIITLDEAFAGIDETNISQLFKTINKLEFNYIMTSQQLQAEYNTVPSLNTYELLRNKGEDGNFVTAIKFHWNGKKQEEE